MPARVHKAAPFTASLDTFEPPPAGSSVAAVSAEVARHTAAPKSGSSSSSAVARGATPASLFRAKVAAAGAAAVGAGAPPGGVASLTFMVQLRASRARLLELQGGSRGGKVQLAAAVARAAAGAAGTARDTATAAVRQVRPVVLVRVWLGSAPPRGALLPPAAVKAPAFVRALAARLGMAAASVAVASAEQLQVHPPQPPALPRAAARAAPPAAAPAPAPLQVSRRVARVTVVPKGQSPAPSGAGGGVRRSTLALAALAGMVAAVWRHRAAAPKGERGGADAGSRLRIAPTTATLDYHTTPHVAAARTGALQAVSVAADEPGCDGSDDEDLTDVV